MTDMTQNDNVVKSLTAQELKVVDLPDDSIVIRASFVGNKDKVNFEIFSNLSSEDSNIGLAMLIYGMVKTAQTATEQLIDIGSKSLNEIAKASMVQSSSTKQ